MLSSVKKFKPSSNEFIYPYLIHTDSKGLITSVCEPLSLFLSGFGIIDYLYKNIADVFALAGRLHPSLPVGLPENKLPEIIDLFFEHPGKKSNSIIRWICTPVYAKNKLNTGWQLTGMEIPLDDKSAGIHRKGNPLQVAGAVTEKKSAKQELIMQAVVNAQEKERAEIGKELHDNVNQILSTAKLYLELARNDDAERLNLVVRSAKNIHQAINEIRNISRSLLLPGIADLGLTDSVNDLIENIKAIKAIHVEFYAVGGFEEKISDQQKLMLFRIIQEQVNNVLKHSEAKNLIIELVLVENENRIVLNITDDGKGFDAAKMKYKRGLGLSNINSRAVLFGGRVSIISSKGQGCKLNVQVPIHNL